MKKLHLKKGFTIAEMLIALAILIILLAVSAPMVTNWQRSLRMTELDDYARELFMTAQYQLTTREAEGALENLEKKLQVDYAAQKLTSEPYGFAAAGGTTLDYMYYLKDRDADAAVLVPEASFANSVEGNYLIELDARTGAVYGVFYWEDDLEVPGTVDYHTMYDFITGEMPDRERDTRSAYLLGYYGGAVEAQPPSKLQLGMQAELINSEELYLKISYTSESLTEALLRYGSSLKITVTISDESGSAPYEKELTGTDLTSAGLNRMEAYILLDSVESGYDFETLTGLNPGDNLTVAVSSRFEETAEYPAQSASVTLTGENSLFRSKEGGKIVVDTVRHLRNLDETYFTDVPSGVTTISQEAEIDFDNTNFAFSGGIYRGTGQSNPLSSITPITNDTLFLRGSDDGSVFDGNLLKISHFVITSGGTYTGLFAQIENLDLKEIRVTDIKVTGSGTTGGLAGSIANASVENCAVYVDDEDVSGSRLEQNYNSVYSVRGSSNTGGLAGRADNVTFSDSFAAIRVSGGDNTGGFVGAVNGGSADSCYGSGDVSGGTSAGGFAGNASGFAAQNCYSTSDVSADDTVGGFMGKATGGSYSGCKSYGLVEVTAGGTAGGFTSGSTASHTGCSYLMQEDYNSNLDYVHIGGGVGSANYSALKAASPIAIANSHPYDSRITGTRFPFPTVHSTQTHYGNWPLQHTIDTSLVYYEKYYDEDSDSYYYGYYCVTRILIASGQMSNQTWVLNTLEDKACVEDGYALLSIYELDRFSYRLDVGSDGADIKTGTLHVTLSDNPQYSPTTAVRLHQQGAVTFYGYEGTGLDVETDYTKLTPVDSYETAGMYLYQFPYALQHTDRSEALTFYDELIISNGYAETGELVISRDQEFLYCPHFAKMAVNSGIPHDADPQNVRIRSARHLNLLGLNAYYWNAVYGTNDDVNFLQETDVCFSTYAVDGYCGENLNLYASNRPIGNPDAAALGGQFRNTYDGQGKKIIDYGITSREQFVGLFGEILDATIKNVVMTVSAPGKGYIHCVYENGGNSASVAVGAIAGLSYHDGDKRNVIENCTVAGYEVKYTMANTAGVAGDVNTTGIALGGLVGVNLCGISNCSAENDVILDARVSRNIPITLGGLTGSSYYMTLENSYSGGTLSITAANDVTLGGYVIMGGVTGGVMHLYNNAPTSYRTTTKYQNLYTYTQIEEPEFPINNLRLYPVAGRIFAGVSLGTGPQLGNTAGQNLDGVIALSNCHYLDTAFAGLAASATYDAVQSRTYDELANLSTAGLTNRVTDALHSFPVDTTLKGKYPFPAVIRENSITSGDYVHYGDWPPDTRMVTLSRTYPVYYEQYADGSTGLYYVDAEDVTYSTLDAADKEITNTGYGLLMVEAGGESIIATTDLGGLPYYVVPQELTVDTGNIAAVERLFPYESFDVVNGVAQPVKETVEKKRYVNENFGAAISVYADLGTAEGNPLQVRTLQQFVNAGSVAGDVIYMKQTHSIPLASLAASVDIKAGHTYHGGADSTYPYALKGAVITPFGTNDGTITHTAVRDSRIQDTAGLVHTNNGTVRHCFTYAEITHETQAAGLVFENSASGRIVNSYASGTVDVNSGAAAGLVLRNAGSVTGCYSAGSVSGTAAAYGFMQSGKAESCYSVAEVSGLAEYGFAESGTVTNCYWGYSDQHNEDVSTTGGAGTAVRLRQLNLQTGLGAADDMADFPETLSGNYPYYSAVGLPHYGDWPVDERSRQDVSLSGNYVGLFYYEQYVDGEYGVYAVGYNQENVRRDNIGTAAVVYNDLSKENEMLQASGYGVFYYNGYVSGGNDDRTWRIKAGTFNYDNDGDNVNGVGAQTDLFAVDGYTFRILQQNADADAPGAFSRYLRCIWQMNNRRATGQLSLSADLISRARANGAVYP